MLVEEYENFDIFWYHWPKDGDGLKQLLIGEEDYEPVIVFYDGNEVCMAYTRRHWFYQDYRVDEGMILPVEILFDGESHPPYVNDASKDERFDRKRADLIKREYDTTPIKKEDISKKFRTGEGHHANYKNPFGAAVEDPLVRAQACYADYLARKGAN